MRNTPTGVGKTFGFEMATLNLKKHPHGRGEDLFKSLTMPFEEETPPRAWGRPSVTVEPLQTDGNTPTGVGKTPLPPPFGVYKRNTPTGVGKTMSTRTDRFNARKHPHGRGEDSLSLC